MHSESSSVETAGALLAESIQALVDCADSLPASLCEAGELLVSSLLGEGRVLCCGVQQAELPARHLVELLLHGFGQARPSLPALLLDASFRPGSLEQAAGSEGQTGAGTEAQTAQDQLIAAYADIYARQIRAFGESRDVMVMFCRHADTAQVQNAVATANDQDIRSIIVCDQLGQVVPQGSLVIELASGRAHLFQELLSIVVHGLYDRVERSVFGSGLLPDPEFN